jgi:hypothetical protein
MAVLQELIMFKKLLIFVIIFNIFALVAINVLDYHSKNKSKDTTPVNKNQGTVVVFVKGPHSFILECSVNTACQEGIADMYVAFYNGNGNELDLATYVNSKKSCYKTLNEITYNKTYQICNYSVKVVKFNSNNVWINDEGQAIVQPPLSLK